MTPPGARLCSVARSPVPRSLDSRWRCGNRGRSTNRGRRVVERLTRTGPNAVAYEFTVDDPTPWTRPFTGTVPWRRTDGPLFEYACHEGNYGLHGILAGARRKNTQRITEVP